MRTRTKREMFIRTLFTGYVIETLESFFVSEEETNAVQVTCPLGCLMILYHRIGKM